MGVAVNVNISGGGCKPTNKKISAPALPVQNRFSGGCSCNNSCAPKKPTTKSVQYVTDVHWYPDERTLVIEKNNHKNIVVNLTDIIPAEPKLDEDIRVLVWNPITEKYNKINVANKGDEYTDALQKIVASIGSADGNVFNNNVRHLAQIVVDEKLVWKEWDDAEPNNH